MWLVTVSARQDIITALSDLIGRENVGTSIKCSAAAVFFRVPVKGIKVPTKRGARNDVYIVVAVGAEGDKIC
jgi:hypothetical protein